MIDGFSSAVLRSFFWRIRVRQVMCICADDGPGRTVAVQVSSASKVARSGPDGRPTIRPAGLNLPDRSCWCPHGRESMFGRGVRRSGGDDRFWRYGHGGHHQSTAANNNNSNGLRSCERPTQLGNLDQPSAGVQKLILVSNYASRSHSHAQVRAVNSTLNRTDLVGSTHDDISLGFVLVTPASCSFVCPLCK